MAKESLQLHLLHRAGRYEQDPFMTFDWIFEVCENAGFSASFNFICAHSSKTRDGCYNINEPFIRGLLRTINRRGHEIGMHGSYNSHRDLGQLTKEAQVLRSVMEEEQIRQPFLGSRQHYLRWSTSETARFLSSAQIDYDSTLGFADAPGFRCGTCSEYTLYDVAERRALPLRERPLIVMEVSVLSNAYLGTGHTDEALQLMIDYKNTCRRFKGDFVLLWHNNRLVTPTDRRFFSTLLSS